jgi:pseudaminic acid synthase
MKLKTQLFKEDNPHVFIIAELSANHNQDFDIAVKTIQAIKEAGADAVKIQTYTPETMTIDCQNSYFRIKQDTIWDGQTLYELYKKAYTPWEWHPKLKKIAEEIGLTFFSSPFDKTSVDFLEKLNVPAYKIASFEITDIPFIKYVASKNKMIFISTGIATYKEIEEAVQACRQLGNDNIVVLKCTSAYPAPFKEINLKTIPDMIQKFNTIVGLSDHTLGHDVALASIALGSKVIEKHFTLDKKIKTPDASFSLDPNEFKKMVMGIRNIEKALGSVTYTLTEKMKKGREFSRSIFVVKHIKKGDKFTEKNIRSIRPGFGLSPKKMQEIIGKRSKKDLIKGTPLNLAHLDIS